MASSIICAWIRLEPADREAFLGFHDREHIPERLAVPGFRSGRRFECTADPNRFLVVYEVDSIDVLDSSAYLDRQNDPTEWTRRTIPLIRDPRRIAISLDLSLGQARGGAVALVHLGRQPPDRIRDIVDQLRALSNIRGVLAVHFGRVDVAASDIPTVERQALRSPDNAEGVVILVEATDPAVASAALAGFKTGVESWRLQSSLT